ncbi:MAG: hypothetical protein R6X06_03060 [Gammaproteobacteria bacterium]
MNAIIKNDGPHTSVRNLLRIFSLLCLLSLGTIPAAQAATWNVIINGKAIHTGDAPAGTTFNEDNWGAGIQYDFDEIDGKWVPFVTASGFSDSFKNASYNAGGGTMRRFKFGQGWHFDAGVYAFAMTRKDVNDNAPFLGVLPVISVGTEMISVNMTYVPKVRPKFAELFFFQLKINAEIFN